MSEALPAIDIWAHAKMMGKALIEVAPKDIRMECGEHLRLECTIRTIYEAEAVREIIRTLMPSLTAHRVMVRGDIYPPDPPPSYHDELCRVLGDPALLPGGQL